MQQADYTIVKKDKRISEQWNIFNSGSLELDRLKHICLTKSNIS